MANYRLFFNEKQGRQAMRCRWTQQKCEEFVAQARVLERCGNPGRFRWCCGLREAVENGNYLEVRRWIKEHQWMVQRLLSYQMVSRTGINK